MKMAVKRNKQIKINKKTKKAVIKFPLDQAVGIPPVTRLLILINYARTGMQSGRGDANRSIN
jgi:hypothetical protein